jgi:outer membrane protein
MQSNQRMKKVLALIFAILVFGLFVYSEVKIGVIDSQMLIQKSKIGIAANAKFENIGKQKQQQVQNMQAGIKKLEKELVSAALNNATREKKSLELQEKKTNFKRFVEDAQKEIQMLNQKELRSLQEKIYPIIQQIGKEKGFSLIVDINTRIYHDQAVDITNDVIKAMDAKLSVVK